MPRQENLDFQLRNRWSLSLAHTEEFKRFEKDFRNRATTIGLGYNTREYQSVSVGYQFGRNFDADFRLWSATAQYKVTSRLSAEYSLAAIALLVFIHFRSVSSVVLALLPVAMGSLWLAGIMGAANLPFSTRKARCSTGRRLVRRGP